MKIRMGYPVSTKTGDRVAFKTSTTAVFDENGIPVSDTFNNINTQLPNLSNYRLCIFGDGLSREQYDMTGSGITDDYPSFATLLSTQFKSYINHSISNTIVSDIDENDATIISYVERFSELPPASDVDVIMVFTTSNDWAYSVPIGENFDNTRFTYKGALNLLIDYMISKYYDKDIIFVTPLQRHHESAVNTTPNGVDLYSSNDPNAAGKRLIDYANAIKEICAIHAIPVIDMHSICGINFASNETQIAELSEQGSEIRGVMPNEKGCYIIYKRLLKALTAII